jgi:hypothetical protein
MADPLTAEQQHERRRAVRDLMPNTPFMGGLGIVFERYEPDPSRFESRSRFRSGKTSPTTAPIFTAA